MSGFYSTQRKLNERMFILDKFLGCDFTQGDFITDYRRSPNCKNLIWGDNPYIPRMRSGYKPVAEPWANSPNINGIHILGNSILVHAGTKMYKLTGNAEPYSYEEMSIGGQAFTLTDEKTRSFLFETSVGGTVMTCLYIIGGGRYLRFDGTNLVEVKSVAKVPMTVVGRKYDGGGQNKEAVNLLSASQIYSFYVDEEEVEVQHTATTGETTMTLEHSDYRNLNIYKETDNGDEQIIGYSVAGATVTFNEALTNGTLYKAIYLTWNTAQDYTLEKDVSVDYVKSKGVTLTAGENNDYQYNSTTGILHFATAPTGIRGFEGTDTIEVKFTKATNPAASKIENCKIFDIYGGKNDTRVFLTGNDTYPNYDWYSSLYDASYFPDNCFTVIGTSNTKIMGYIKQYNTQMIIKEDNAFEASAYLRQYSIDADGNDAFPVEQGITGVGAVSKDAFGYLNGEPLFLTSKGVVGVSGTNVDYRNLCQDRSEKINTRLIGKSLANAFSVDLNNKYYLFVGDGVYIADARMMYTDALGKPQYEWQYWDGINAQCAATYNGKIYFGYKGVVYRFKVSGDEDEYIDERGNKKYAIPAFWETPRLYFGSISNKKSAAHIHCFCDDTIMAKMKIEAIADERPIDLGVYDNTNQLDFGNLDFAEFLFDGSGDEDVKNIHAGIQRFTSIKFKFSSVEDAEISNLGFGLKMLQVNYIYLEE